MSSPRIAPIPLDKNHLAKPLIDNGFDFLSKSILDFEGAPKFSVINFYTAVELFVKARLMAEHWSLVVSKRKEPDWKDFVSGDFQSVTLEEASTRLHKIVRDGLTDQERLAFSTVRNHRNKMVHFYHKADTEESNKKQLQSIAKEQLVAWNLLHRLLRGRWRSTFSPWGERIAQIAKDLRKHHTFLQVVYESTKPDIEALKSSGKTIDTCPSCGFGSQHHETCKNELYEAECLVCGCIDKCLVLECPECGADVCFRNEGFSKCNSCEKQLEPEFVADKMIDDAAHTAARDGDDSYDLGNCSQCDGYHTVVRMKDELYLCTSCFEVFEYVNWCGWCNEPNTGDMEDSYLVGCNQCDGRSGWDND